MTPRKPDFSDAGYGQVGCLLAAVGVLGGAVISLAMWVVASPELSPLGDDPVSRLVGIGLLAVFGGLLAGGLATEIVQRVAVLWRFAEVIAFGAPPVAAAIIVPIGVFVPAVGERALVVSAAVFAISTVLVFAVLILAFRQSPRR